MKKNMEDKALSPADTIDKGGGWVFSAANGLALRKCEMQL